jgi:hypothetical protein
MTRTDSISSFQIEDITPVLRDLANEETSSKAVTTLLAQVSSMFNPLRLSPASLSEIPGIGWSSQPNFGVLPRASADASLLAVVTRANRVRFLRLVSYSVS